MAEPVQKYAAGLIPYYRVKAGDTRTTLDFVAFVQRRSKEACRNPDHFGLFGGGLEAGETPEQALIREIKEELSIDISVPPYHYSRLVDFAYTETYGTVNAYEYAMEVTPDFAEKVKVCEGEYGCFMSEAEIRASNEFVEGHRQMILNFFNSLK